MHMDQKSTILDNKNRRYVKDFFEKNLTGNEDLSIVSAFFTIYAYDALKSRLENIDSLRFLFGEPQFVLDPDREIQPSYDIQDNELRLSNRLVQKAIAKECSEWIKEKVEIRSIKHTNLLHGKMYHIQKSAELEYAMLGSSNFTSSGLGAGVNSNIELNLELSDNRDRSDLLAWFNELWDSELVEDVKSKVLGYLERLYSDTAPEFLYYLTLFHLFGRSREDQIEQDIIEERIGFLESEVWNTLYKFQQDGVKGAINKIRQHNGCIIADSVGLGKTFEALAVIKYFELMNNRVLVLCPKKLRANWALYRNNDQRNILLKDRLRYDILSHTDLSRTSGTSGDIDLGTLHWENYDLVVIDESHNFRNSTYGSEKGEDGKKKFTRYERLMENVLKSGAPTKVLLLSATPVNNTLRDLRNQIYLITQQRDDALLASAGINNIGSTLKFAQKTFSNWADAKRGSRRRVSDLLEKLDSGFFKLLDELTIARSRKHIKRYYDLSAVGEFPQRLQPKSESPQLDLQDEFPSYERLNRDISSFRLAVYNPSAFVLDRYLADYDISTEGKRAFDEQSTRENFLIGMMKVNLLKRLESSVKSFEYTLRRMLERIDRTIDKIKNYDANITEYTSTDLFDELEDDELEELKEKTEVGTKLRFELAHLDRERWRQDLQEDRDQFISLINNAAAIQPERDGKLERLKEIIVEKQNTPINDGNKKVLVFTAFADTAEYLYDNLHVWAIKERESHTALVMGGNERNKTTLTPRGYKHQSDFDSILTNFSPRAKSRDKIVWMPQHEEIDILVATDCVSEGQNLQDCDCVINYDIHWNPVRIIQRYGRIDRIGSTNEKIMLVNFWPTEDLNQYIKLKERVEARMALVDLAATAEENLLSVEQVRDMIEDELTYRDKQLVRLKEEIIDLEEMDENVNLSEFTLDDFRSDLMNYLQLNKEKLEAAPLGLYTIVSRLEHSDLLPGLSIDASLQKIVTPGVIFCLRHVSNETDLEKVNPLQPYFLVYIKDDGNVRYNFVNVKQILTMYQALCLGKTNALENFCRLFEQKTSNGTDMTTYNELLQKTVDAIAENFKKRDWKNLFTGRDARLVGEEAIKNDFQQFELITWLVILDPIH
jgi:SNF2 family DNA or RNA helicase